MSRLAAIGCLLLGVATAGAAEIKFRKTTLDTKFRSEGVAVGDFNHDGKLDIAAGDAYYAAPDWRPVVYAEEQHEYEPLKYSRCFNMFADDINGDGWTDLTLVEYPGQETVWRENPKGADKPWPRHIIVGVSNNESPQYRDIDGDGVREWLMGTAPTSKAADGPEKVFAVIRRPVDA
ncbi:MAG TPA: FG-GAP-like repeat-containing protein, partial [Pirellulales bacterium]|nr:FG-GAP-like repeat-containing protein [Pirellulales bacterium]